MQENLHKAKRITARDRIEGNAIILSGEGKFPKKLIIVGPGHKRREYELKKTASGKYLLN